MDAPAVEALCGLASSPPELSWTRRMSVDQGTRSIHVPDMMLRWYVRS